MFKVHIVDTGDEDFVDLACVVCPILLYISVVLLYLHLC